MNRSVFILVFLCFADGSISQETSSKICQGITGKYCRPISSIKYRFPHNDYRGNSRDTVTGAPPSDSRPSPAPANTFEDLAQNLFAAESAIRRYCLENSVANVKETFGILNFELTYYLQNVNVNEVTVQIKHRVIHVTIVKFGVTIFKDLRILPSVVNPELATWTIENGQIKVTVPYTALNANTSEKCSNIKDTLINVPKSTVTIQNDNEIPIKEPVIKVSDEVIDRIFGSPDGAGIIDIRFQDEVEKISSKQHPDFVEHL